MLFKSTLFLYFQILPKIFSKVFVTAGNASIFSASMITSILLISLFIMEWSNYKLTVEQQ